MKLQYELVYNSHLGWLPSKERARFLSIPREKILHCYLQDLHPVLVWSSLHIRLWRTVQHRVRDAMIEPIQQSLE